MTLPQRERSDGKPDWFTALFRDRNHAGEFLDRAGVRIAIEHPSRKRPTGVAPGPRPHPAGSRTDRGPSAERRVFQLLIGTSDPRDHRARLLPEAAIKAGSQVRGCASSIVRNRVARVAK